MVQNYMRLSDYTIIVPLNKYSQCKDIDSSIDSFLKQSNTSYSPKQVLYIIEHAINPIIFNAANKPTRPLGFIFKRSIISAQTVCSIANGLSFLFNKYVIICLMVLSLILNIVYITQPNILHYNGHLGLEGILLILVITILSSLIHEFGHASACIRYGVSPGNIGVGLYLNFPLFYTDVTGIWCLSQKHRHVVNLAGIYFQSVLLIILDCIYFIIPNEIIRFIILSILLSFAITLNPFLSLMDIG